MSPLYKIRNTLSLTAKRISQKWLLLFKPYYIKLVTNFVRPWKCMAVVPRIIVEYFQISSGCYYSESQLPLIEDERITTTDNRSR